MYQQAKQFLKEHTPLINHSRSFCPIRCPSTALLARFFIRNSIPIMFGIGAGVATNSLEEMTNASEHISDIVSCITTLVIAYGMDWLLEKCWPINPYSPRQSIFSGFRSNNNNANISMGERIWVPVA